MCVVNVHCWGCREGVVMVCTDAAARGIDIPDVTHVVQADFAASAVDFLHRVSPQNNMDVLM
jgi:ERCC4-related helicase